MKYFQSIKRQLKIKTWNCQLFQGILLRFKLVWDIWFNDWNNVFLVIACHKNNFSTAENTWISSFVFNIICFGMVRKQWFKNVWMTIIFLIYHCWFQLIIIVIPKRAILDFQNNPYFQETWQTNATISCYLWKKNRVLHQKCLFLYRCHFGSGVMGYILKS